MTYIDRATTKSGLATFPIVASGRWHVDGMGSGAQGPTLQAGRAMGSPLWVGRTCTLVGIAINIGATFTNVGTIRAGLFTMNTTTWYPDALITDYGTIVEATGTQSGWTISSALTPRNPYAVVLTWQGGTLGTPTASSRNISHPLVIDPSGSAINPNTNRTAYYTDTGFSGAYPSSYGTPAGIMVGPAIAYKFTT